MLCSVGSVLAQDAVYVLNKMQPSYTENGETLAFDGGDGSDVKSDYTDLRKNATITLSGKNLRYVRLTFANNAESYTLKWGGAWTVEGLNPNNTISGTGSVIIVSNTGTPYLQIKNEAEAAVPIAKVEVFYWNKDYKSTGEQTDAKADENKLTGLTCQNNIVSIGKINVVGTYASLGSDGKGVMLANTGGYLSIKFDGEMDLGELTNFQIEGTNVTKQGNSTAVFDEVQFICTDGTVYKQWEPSNCSFTIGDEQSQKLKKTKEIRILNKANEGTFTISAIKFVFGGSHAKKSAPVLGSETQKEMTVFAGETVKLQNGSGFWREYKDGNYNEIVATRIPTNQWEQNYEFSGDKALPVGDYYFGVRDARNCELFNIEHSSELVKVHVRVNEAKKYANPFEKEECGNLHTFWMNTLNAGGTAEITDNNGANITTGEAGGYVNFLFQDPVNLTDMLGWQMGTSDNSAITYVGFYNGETKIRDYWTNPTNRTLTDDQKLEMESVTEIRIGIKQNSNVKISYVQLRLDKKVGITPTLSAPTEEEMEIVEGQTLKLRITNIAGYWREYSDDTYSTVVNTRINSVNSPEKPWEFKPSYDITGLAPGDYYFAIRDGSNCKLGHRHESELVKVHVHVKAMPNCNIVTTENSSDKQNGETETYWDGSHMQMLYAKNIDGVGKVTAKIVNTKNEWNNHDGVTCSGFRMTQADGTQLIVEAPVGYRVNYVKVNFCKESVYNVSFNQGVYMPAGTASYVDWTVENKENNQWNDKCRMVIRGVNDQTECTELHIKDVYVKIQSLYAGSIDENRKLGGRDYWIYVPKAVVEGTEEVPVVFSLHGVAAKGEPTNSGVQNFNSLAEKNNFIVVYPQGRDFAYEGYDGTATGWEATGIENADITFFKNIITEVGSKFHINKNKVYITGYSVGGMMTYAAANAASNVFAAYASVSGLPMNEMHLQHHGLRAVPFLHIHGTHNTASKYELVPTIVDNMIVRNGLSYTPNTNKQDGYTLYSYEGTGKQPFYYYEIEDMGHEKETTIGTKDSKEVIWDFFKNYTLDTTPSDILFSANVDENHGWIVNDGLVAAKYGESGGNQAGTSNVYHSVQLNGNKHYWLKFNATNTKDTDAKITARVVKLGNLDNFDVLNYEPFDIVEDVKVEKTYFCKGDISFEFTTPTEDAEYAIEFIKGSADDATTISVVSIETSGVAAGDEAELPEVSDFGGYYRFNNRLSAQWNFDQCDAYRFNIKNISSSYWTLSTTESTDKDKVYVYNRYAGTATNPDFKNIAHFEELTYAGDKENRVPILAGLLFNAPAGHIKVHVYYDDNGIQKGTRLEVDPDVKLCIPYVENTFRNDMGSNAQPNDGNQPDYKNSVHHWKRDILYVSLKQGNVWDIWTGKGWKKGHIVNKSIDDDSQELFNAGGSEYVNGVTWQKMNYTGTHGVPCVIRFQQKTVFNRLAVNRNLTYSFYSEYISDFGTAFERPSSRIRVVGTPKGAQVANVGPFLEHTGAIAFTYGGWKTEKESDVDINGVEGDVNDYYSWEKQRVSDKWSELGVFTGQKSGADAFKTWSTVTNDVDADSKSPVASDGFPVLSVLYNRAASGSLSTSDTPATADVDGGKVDQKLPNYYPNNNGNLFGGNNYPYKANITPWSLPSRGAYLKFEPSYPGVLNVHILQLPGVVYHIADEFGIPYSDNVYTKNATSDKSVVVVGATDSKAKGYKLEGGNGKADYVKYSFNVYPGKTYYMFSNETGMGFAGFYFEPFVNRFDSKTEYATAKDVNESDVSDTDIEFARKDVGVYSVTLNTEEAYTRPTFSIQDYEAGDDVDDAKGIKTVHSPKKGGGTEDFDFYYSKRAVKVRIDRQFKKDTWNTICLPFSMNQVQMENVFGKDTRVVLLRDLQKAERTNDDKRTLSLICHENQDIIAGYPYFILPKQDVPFIETYACFDKFPQTQATDVPSNLTISSVGPNTNAWDLSLNGEADYTMKGTFAPATMKKGSLYVGGGKLKKLTADNVTLNPFRAWLDLTGESTATGNSPWAKRLDAVVGIDADLDEFEDEATDIDIDELLADQGIFTKVADVYSVNGQLVRKNASNLNDLPKGIYVVNGKKYIVK